MTSRRPRRLTRISTFHADDNWVRALVFHPSGKFLVSASDDKTIRTWDLATGRCLKVLEAHGHFVTTLAWGRAKTSSTVAANGAGGAANGASTAEAAQVVNVVASGSVDQTVKVCGRHGECLSSRTHWTDPRTCVRADLAPLICRNLTRAPASARSFAIRATFVFPTLADSQSGELRARACLAFHNWSWRFMCIFRFAVFVVLKS